MKLIPSLCPLLLCVNLCAQMVSVNWGAQNSNGLGLADGTELAIGDLVRLGAFNLTDAQIQANQWNLGFLNANFVEFGHAAIGDDVGIPAHWNAVSIGSTDSLGLNGHRMYLWAFDSPSLSNATQQGIFSSSQPSWIFPSVADVPNTTAIDLEQVPSSEIVVGGFGVGRSTANGATLYNLALVPEPQPYSFVLAGLCLGFLVARKALNVARGSAE